MANPRIEGNTGSLSTRGFGESDVVRGGLSKIVVQSAEGAERADLLTLDSDVKKLTRALESAINTGSWGTVASKRIENGKATIELYVQNDELANVQSVLSRLISREGTRGLLSGTSSAGYTLGNATPVDFIHGYVDIYGRQAQALAKKEMLSVAGGKILSSPTLENPNRMEYMIPYQSDWAQGDEHFSDFLNKTLSQTMVKSNYEKARQEQEAEEYKTKAELIAIQKQKLEYEKNNLKQIQMLEALEKSEEKKELQTNVAKAKKMAMMDALTASQSKEAEGIWSDFEKEENKKNERKIKEEERKQLQEDKESKRILKGSIFKIAGTLTIISDITRRILTATLSMASDTKKQAIEARNLGSTYEAVRAYNYSDTAMGLPEGTTLGALQSLQKMFGNTANIDTNALKWLAMVMGNDVNEMVMSGLGGSNPEKLMEHIMDAFFKNQQLGVDQYGNQVGQEQARRSLVTLLESVSPDLARIFSRMVEANTYGINAGRIGSYADYLALNKPALGNLNSLSFGVINALGEEVDSISAKFKNLAKILQGELSIALIGVIDKINNLDWGKSKEEKLIDYEKTLKRLSEKKSGLLSDISERKTEALDIFKSYGVDAESYEDVIALAQLNPFSLTEEQKEQRRRLTRAMLENPLLASVVNEIGIKQDIVSDIGEQLESRNPEYKASEWAEENISRKVAESLYNNKLYKNSQKSILDKAMLGTEYQSTDTFDELVRPFSQLKKGELGTAISYMQYYKENPIYEGKMATTSDWLKRTIALSDGKSSIAKNLVKKLQKFYGKDFTYDTLLHTPSAYDLGALLMLDDPKVQTVWDSMSLTSDFNKDVATMSAQALRTLKLNNIPLSAVTDINTTKDTSGMYKIILEVQQDGKSTIVSSDPVDLAGEFQTKLKYDTANKSMQETSKNGKINLNK